MNIRMKKLLQPLNLGLALIGGGGFILILIGLGVGAIGGPAADSGLVNGAFGIGLALFIFGVVGWAAVTRPWQHFDDINVAQYTGHHDHGAHDDHAMVAASESHTVETHAAPHS